MGDVDPTTAGSVNDLWQELNLGQLLEGVKETNKKSAMGLTQTKDPFAGHKKVLANPSYNAVMGRYKTGPRGPKIVTKETLSRLSDPARGKYTSPSREAQNDAIFKQQVMRQRQEEEDGASFFLTEYQDAAQPGKPPAVRASSLRARLEHAARAAESMEEEGPMSPSGKRYTSAQRIAEGKRKAKMMDSLLHGRNAVQGARQNAKSNSQTRAAETRTNRVKRATQSTGALPKSRVTTGGSQMSRNRQARVDSQASIMSGRGRESRTRYDSRTGRVQSNRTSHSRNPSQSREPSVTRGKKEAAIRGSSVDRSRARDRSVGRAEVGRDRSNDSRAKREWVQNPSSTVDKDKQHRDNIARLREERLKAIAEKKAKNEQKFNSSIRSNSSAESSMKKVPTGVMSGSRSAATVRRRPANNNTSYDSDNISNASSERRAKTEQRSHKSRNAPVTGLNNARAAAARQSVMRGTPLKSTQENPHTADSEANSSLQYSPSSAGSPTAKQSRADARSRFMEKKGFPIKKPTPSLPTVPDGRSSSNSGGNASKPDVASAKHSIPFSKPAASVKSSGVGGQESENKYPDRFKSSDRDKLMSLSNTPIRTEGAETENKGAELNVEMALKRAEEMSKSLKNTNNSSSSKESSSKKTDQDTASFAALLATHAKRISGKLENAQTLDENYKKMIGIL